MNSRIKYLVVSASACLAVLLLIGSVLGKGADQADDAYKHIGVFSDVVAHIKSEYVEEPDMKSVTLGALNGMLEAIDPFASYLNADQYKDYLKNKDVKRADVGLVLSKKFGYMGDRWDRAGSPAAKAGLSTHDMIETIKGIATRDMPLAYAGLLLEGEPGTTVELSVVRVRRPEPQTITLTRANLTLPPVEAKMLDGQVGYIDIDALSPGRGEGGRRRHREAPEGRRAETGGGSAQLRRGHAGRRHRPRQSVPEQGAHHLPQGQRCRGRISTPTRPRPSPACRWRCSPTMARRMPRKSPLPP